MYSNEIRPQIQSAVVIRTRNQQEKSEWRMKIWLMDNLG